MVKGTLTDGRPFLEIKVKHFVTKIVFANALASHCWEKRTIFNPTNSKRTVMKMLKRNLFFQGIEGLDRSHWDAACQEFSQPYEDAFMAATKWIEKNYPYLK